MKFRYAVLFALLMPGINLFADPKNEIEDSKTVKKSFAISRDATVEISNKYGRITVNTWNVDSVKFEVNIKSRHKNEDIVEDLLNNTLVKFSNNRTYVVAKTEFEDESSALISGLSQITDILTNRGKNSLSIDYTVSLPASSNIVIVNHFGNLILDNLTGNAQIKLSYGDLKIGDYDGYINASIEFGDFIANKLNRINLTSQYCDVVIYNVTNADINSKSSKINIQKADRIRCRSKRDDYTIYQLNSISSNSTYTSYVITELRSNLNITSEYGNITIHSVQKGFDKISINSEHSNANLSFDNDCVFQLDIHLEEGDFTYPQQTGKITEKQAENPEIRTYYGSFGNGNSSSSLEIFGEDTDVNITIK